MSQRVWVRRALPCALLGVWVLVLAQAAGAHALLRQSDPANGASLARAPRAVTLMFTEEPESKLSSIRVLDTAGQQVTQGPIQAVPGQPRTLRVTLGSLPNGVYTVTWRTVSRVDGHVTGGAFAFGVGAVPSEAAIPQVTSPPPSALGAVGRWGFYGSVAFLLGSAWVWSLAIPRASEGSLRALWLAVCAALLGIAAIGEAQREDAGATLGQFLGTSLGPALAWRAIPVLGAVGALLLAGTGRGRQRRTALAALGVCALGAMLADVMAGHAAAGSGGWLWGLILSQWTHFAAIGAWIGGLAALLIAVRGAPDADKAATVRRFSIVAGIALAVVAATGIVQAWGEVGAWERLATTPYGRLVVLKAGLLLTLAALGAINRYRSVPAAGRSLAGLRRVGIAELAVAVLALGAAAVLTESAPASYAAGEAGPAPLVASGSDFGTSVRVRMEITPGFPGQNQFAVTLRDYDTGRPVAADHASLRFALRDRPDIGQSTLELARAGDGEYHGRGSNLSLEGQWTITVVVERGANSTEVPLTLATQSTPQRVRTIEAPGQPTLYSIDLTGGRVLDLYLDPGRPGFNEVHATYIGASGQELPIPQLAVMRVGRAGQSPAPLPVRRFGPGHFIGDARLRPGDWQLDVTVTTTEGEVLQTRLAIHL